MAARRGKAFSQGSIPGLPRLPSLFYNSDLRVLLLQVYMCSFKLRNVLDYPLYLPPN